MECNPFSKYFNKVKKTESCMMRLAKELWCQQAIPSDAISSDANTTNTDSTGIVLVGDSWFGSITTLMGFRKCLQKKKKGVMNVKTSTSGYPKKLLMM